MNASDLHLIPAATGQCLNPEEHAAVQTSLLLLRSAENLAGGVQLWGKVLGVDKDYLVAEGRGEDLLLERKFFYS